MTDEVAAVVEDRPGAATSRSQRRDDAHGPRPARVPIGRVSTADALVQALSREILDGTLPPGTHLVEVDLAAAHGVSRQSLRAALAELVHLGLLQREPHRGVWVPRLTRREVMDLFYVRELLETEAVRRGVEAGVSWAGVEVAVRSLGTLTVASPWADVVEGDLAFHHALVTAVDSPHLSRAHDLLLGELRLSLAGNVGREVPDNMIGEHRRLVDVIRAGDPAVAVARLLEHLRTGLELISSSLPES